MTVDTPPHRTVLIAVLGVGLFLATLWLVSQGSLSPVEPGKFAATLFLLIESGLVIGAYWLALAGLGWPLRLLLAPRSRYPAVVQPGIGLALMLLLDWLLALAGWLDFVTAAGLVALGLALLTCQLVLLSKRQPSHLEPWGAAPWSLLLWPMALGLLVVACCCPPGTLWRIEALGYDALSYHLQLPREWLELGRMTGLRHNVYSYLPNLVEAGYMHLGALRGGMYDALYWAQFFHASLGVYAAVTVACLASQFNEDGPSPEAGALSGALFLSLPWTLVVASLPYNEMAVMALGGLGLLLAFDSTSERWRCAALIGALGGTATLAKLTAGPMIVLPVLALLGLRLNHALRWRQPPTWRRAALLVAVTGLAALLTVSPYLLRNWWWTGNPVFPMLADQLGSGHWDTEQVQRWDRGHDLSAAPYDRVSAVDRQWLRNAGYGAVAGAPGRSPDNNYNIARFDTEGGVPVVWIAAGLGLLLSLTRPAARRAGAGLLLVMAVQVVFWVCATHLQSRFLLPTLLPGCALVGLGAHRLKHFWRGRLRCPGWSAAVLLVLLMQAHSHGVFLGQIVGGLNRDTGRYERLEPWQVIDSVPSRADALRFGGETDLVREHPINRLPADTKTLMVADASRVFYLLNPVVYHSAFDREPLGDLWRELRDAGAVTAELRRRGVTHVWVHWAELRRLHATYGYDPDVTPMLLLSLERQAHWRRTLDYPDRQSPVATLYELP